ncbi:unnamed protein product, partial [Aphanomyces euteiches]
QDNENDNQLKRKPPVQRTPIELFDRRGRPTPRLYNEQANDPWIVALRALTAITPKADGRGSKGLCSECQFT